MYNDQSNALGEFIFQSKYARYNSNLKRKETFEESVDRILQMHLKHLKDKYPEVLNNAEFNNDLLEAFEEYKNKNVYGSQRALQFGGDPILRKNEKIFNCSYTYIDSLERFEQIEYLLLCGCGVGCSVEYKHVNILPMMPERLNSSVEEYVIGDSIESWSLAIGRLVQYYFNSNVTYPKFDYSKIRPSGSLISGGFIAPGPDGLRNALNKIDSLLSNVHKTTRRLSPLNCADILSHCADSVLSGGVRRSALAILFSPNDEEMYNSKVGNWFYDNPQRGRYNASVALERSDDNKEVFNKIFESTKEYGEPGFFFRSDSGIGCNPCFEIGFKPVLEIQKLDGVSKQTGIQFCNLISISGKESTTEEKFYKQCKAAATIGTIQATYNSFPFLGEVTEQLAKNDPLIGVSISGIMMNPDILLNENILRKGAEIIKEQNSKIANLLRINPASRTTCIKPDGNISTLTGNTPGCHGQHAKRYIRRVQVNKEEEAGKVYAKYNPKAVVESVWSNNHTDNCIMFAIESDDNVKTKSELLGIKQLEVIKLLYNNWILPGMVDPTNPVCNNVSNTVIVPNQDWHRVKDWVWNNKNFIAGVSFIPSTGDITFTQPPYSEVFIPEELVEMYGDGVIFASGLIVDAEKTFGNLWKACDTFNYKGEKLYSTVEDAKEFIKELNVAEDPSYLNKPHSEWVKANSIQYNNWVKVLSILGYTEEFIDEILDSDIEIPIAEIQKYLDKTAFTNIKNLNAKRDIMRRMKKFGDTYFGEDYSTMIEALKYVQLYHDWCDITRNYTPIDWTTVKWKKVLIDADTTGAQACSGGQCDITKI